MNRDDDASPLSEADWNALRRDAPDPAAVERAYLRFKNTTPRPMADLRLGRWLLSGALAGVSVVSAATGYRWVTATQSASTLAPSAPRSAAPPRPQRPAPSVPPAPRVPESALSSEIPGPRLPAPATLPSVPDTTTKDAKWQDVARALQVRDYARAEAALGAIENGSNGPDRDAASLALAQVLLANGRPSEARSRLERLRESARSELVRNRAKSLLSEMDAREDRSTATPATTQ